MLVGSCREVVVFWKEFWVELIVYYRIDEGSEFSEKRSKDVFDLFGMIY